MNWDDYRVFLEVARSKTLKSAAKNLKVDQATVGRRLASLQENIGSLLLEKRSDGYFLTAAGFRVFESVEKVEREMLTIDRVVAGGDERIEGSIKIAMPGALANHWVIASLKPFLEAHPALEIQFLTGPEVLNLARREADLAVRLVRPEQQELKTKKIGQIRLGLYAAKSYPEPVDISEAPFIGLFESSMSQAEKQFLKSLKLEPNYRLRSAAWSSVYAGIRSSIGIGILPDFMNKRSKDLRALRMDKTEIPLWLVVHPDIAESARVRAVIKHLSTTLS